jgi:rod shape-determining protein MreD
MKGFRDAFVLGVALVLQSAFLYRIEVFGIRPDLLVAFVVYFGWMRGPVAGAIAGFGIGLMQDLDASGPLGVNALAKTVVGFAVAKAGFRVHRSNPGVRFFFFFIAMIAHDVIYFGASSAGDAGLFLKQMFLVAIPTALYTTIVTLFLLGFAERFSRRPLLADEN